MVKVVNKKGLRRTHDVASLIERALQRKGEVTAAQIRASTGFSRTYINRYFRALQSEGRIVLVGKANQARYIPATKKNVLEARRRQTRYRRFLTNKNLSEDRILDEIKEKTGIFLRLPEGVGRVVDYGFTEMLNNAIEHSRSKTIAVLMERLQREIRFVIADRGVGIYRNIMRKKQLESELSAIQDLMKGKQTTDPKQHSGEGIFFTSKLADRLAIKSSSRLLLFDNRVQDIFLKNATVRTGTVVEFSIDVTAQRDISKIFQTYADESYAFSKTALTVHLFRHGSGYVSRSQARRLVSGLEKFKRILLDFKGVDTVGQAFADEVFRVWQRRNPGIAIEVQNAGESARFMIKHVLQQKM
jgi:anti-sigma regulatory factor (Ser/Thr protein kinase)